MKRFLAAVMIFAIALAVCSCRAVSPSYVNVFDSVCSPDEGLALAKRENAVVFENYKVTAGQDVWYAFYERASSGKDVSVVLARLFENLPEDSNLDGAAGSGLKKLYFYKIDYDGKEFTAEVRDSSLKESEGVQKYKYLLHFEGEVETQSRYSSYDVYVLADDQSLTWKDIQKSMFSSHSDDHVKHKVIYETYFE